MISLIVTVHVKPEHLEEFRAAIVQQAANSLKHEDACVQFDVCFDLDEPHVCCLYEKYTHRDAIDAHRQTPYFVEYNATVEPWLTDKQVRMVEVANA